MNLREGRGQGRKGEIDRINSCGDVGVGWAEAVDSHPKDGKGEPGVKTQMRR